MSYDKTRSGVKEGSEDTYKHTLLRIQKIQSHLDTEPRSSKLKDRVCVITGVGSLKGIGWDVLTLLRICYSISKAERQLSSLPMKVIKQSNLVLHIDWPLTSDRREASISHWLRWNQPTQSEGDHRKQVSWCPGINYSYPFCDLCSILVGYCTTSRCGWWRYHQERLRAGPQGRGSSWCILCQRSFDLPFLIHNLIGRAGWFFLKGASSWYCEGVIYGNYESQCSFVRDIPRRNGSGISGSIHGT